MTTATLDTPLPPAPRATTIGRRYGRRWARVPRELGYLALTAVISVVAYSVARALTGIGTGFLVVVGVILLALLLVGSRYAGALELIRLRWARTPAIAPPDWTPPFRGKRPLRALGDVFANGHYWLYGLHTVVLNPLLALVTSVVTFSWIVVALVLVTFPVWGTFVPVPGPGQHVGFGPSTSVDWHRFVASALSGRIDPSTTAVVVAALAAIGLGMLALLPFVTRGLTTAHWGVGRLLLRRFASDDLRADVVRADAARTAAIVAEDAALRRLERDIHDGPQQRLLRIQMELATAGRRIGGGEEGATEAIETARRLAAETLDELRALAQGFAPPLLQDRGLSAALGALGRRGAVPVETAIAIMGDVPEAIERSVYFVAAELTANAVKHAGARLIRLDARTEEVAEGRALLLTVADDGVGGARLEPGHGLRGAVDRLAGLGGTLTVASPAGGGTTVTARLPLPPS